MFDINSAATFELLLLSVRCLVNSVLHFSSQVFYYLPCWWITLINTSASNIAGTHCRSWGERSDRPHWPPVILIFRLFLLYRFRGLLQKYIFQGRSGGAEGGTWEMSHPQREWDIRITGLNVHCMRGLIRLITLQNKIHRWFVIIIVIV